MESQCCGTKRNGEENIGEMGLFSSRYTSEVAHSVPPKRAKYHLGAVSASINWPETLQKVPPSQMEKYKTVNLLFMASMFEANLVNKAKCT